MKYGYGRISAGAQRLGNQGKELRAAGCEKIIAETTSGVRAERPRLRLLLARLEKGDTVIVSRLDQLARSTRDLLGILETITARGATFKSLADRWADTTTQHGPLMMAVVGGLAEFERAMIRFRSGEGRMRARAAGVKFGRPIKLTKQQIREVHRRWKKGESARALARSFKVGPGAIRRVLSNEAVPFGRQDPPPVGPASSHP